VFGIHMRITERRCDRCTGGITLRGGAVLEIGYTDCITGAADLCDGRLKLLEVWLGHNLNELIRRTSDERESGLR
jgi:hypothetical protein